MSKKQSEIFEAISELYENYVTDDLLEVGTKKAIEEAIESASEGIPMFLPTAGIACIDIDDPNIIHLYRVEMADFPRDDEDLKEALYALSKSYLEGGGFPIFVTTSFESWVLEVTSQEEFDNVAEKGSISDIPNRKECILIQVASFNGKTKSSRIVFERDNNGYISIVPGSGDKIFDSKPSRQTIALLECLRETIEEDLQKKD